MLGLRRFEQRARRLERKRDEEARADPRLTRLLPCMAALQSSDLDPEDWRVLRLHELVKIARQRREAARHA